MQVKLINEIILSCQDKPVHSGAEGEIFLSSDGQSAIKLYYKQDNARLRSLGAILDRYNAVRNNAYWRNYLCWPDGIVIQPRLGVTMPLVPRNRKNLNWYLLPKPRGRLTPEERGHWENHVLIALRLSRAMRRLHQLGLCHSDLSRNNCLADATTGDVTVIDLDGLVVPGILPPQVVGTPEFMAPEIIVNGDRPSIYTDLHSLAVLIYQILLFRHPLKGSKFHSANAEEDDRLAFGSKALYIEHPSDLSNRPRSSFVDSSFLGETMQKLLQQAFVAGLADPSQRIQAAAWESEITRLYDRLLPCANPLCEGKYFPWVREKSVICPWCKSQWELFPNIAILSLYRPVSGRNGQFQYDNYDFVSYPGKYLNEWHVLSDHSPGPESDPSKKLIFGYDRDISRWCATNVSSESMQILNENGRAELKSGGKTSLEPNMRLILGSGQTARLALIRIVDPRK